MKAIKTILAAVLLIGMSVMPALAAQQSVTLSPPAGSSCPNSVPDNGLTTLTVNAQGQCVFTAATGVTNPATGNTITNPYLSDQALQMIGNLRELGWGVVAPDLNNVDLLTTSASFVPSATLGTFGPLATILPNAGYTAVFPTQINIVTATVGSETLTFKVVATFNDGTTATVTPPTTTSANTTALTAANILGLFGNGKYIAKLQFGIESTINSSGATATAVVLGLNQR